MGGELGECFLEYFRGGGRTVRIFLDGNSDQVRQQVEKVEKLVMDGESLIAGDNLVDALKGSPPHSEASGLGNPISRWLEL